jgi:hypothetical protein
MNPIKGLLIVGGVAVAACGALWLAVESMTKPVCNVKVGEYVQWESGGKYMFPTPRKVVSINEDPIFGPYVFVEGSKCGIPFREIVSGFYHG